MEDNKPKLLVIDIETSPIVAYTWGPKWETNIIEFIEQSQIICFSAKWIGGKQETKGLPDYSGYKAGIIDDKKIVKRIHELLDEADAVVTQNGRAFDIKVINSRFIKHGLQPPSPYKIIDTLSEAKRYLRLPSYKLNDMGEYFGIGSKLAHEGFDLWKKCIAGVKASWTKMKRYNAQDVVLTEKLYNKIRPFMRTHPNFSVLADKHACPKCGSENVISQGFSANSTTLYRRAQCKDCGGWFRYGKSVIKLQNKRMNV